jgi:hypothetical protein
LPNAKLIVLHTTRAVRHWQKNKLLRELCEDHGELPDCGKLNAAIPTEEWDVGIDSNPRPPWHLNYVAYLLDPADASLYTYVNSTKGAEVAWNKLRTSVQWMRALRGAGVFPVVELGSAPMKKFAKMRPEFRIREWTDLGGGAAATAAAPKPLAGPEPAPAEKPAVALVKPAEQPSNRNTGVEEQGGDRHG